ncbi:MAG: hypothetical protein NUV91_05455, partial [Candidatus Omnitrophica bacterium]|nr:hypothetical protein [Candidatus Omnitrophota bacterium]
MISLRKFQFKILSGLLFCILFSSGILLAHHKPLWNDEIYSQHSSVENISVWRMISGKIPEGNNTPLFYLGQKVISAISGYQTLPAWREGAQNWGERDP